MPKIRLFVHEQFSIHPSHCYPAVRLDDIARSQSHFICSYTCERRTGCLLQNFRIGSKFCIVNSEILMQTVSSSLSTLKNVVGTSLICLWYYSYLLSVFMQEWPKSFIFDLDPSFIQLSQSFRSNTSMLNAEFT